MNITYDKSVDGELAPIVKSRISSIEHLFPNWLHQVLVFVHLNGDSHLEIACVPNYAYRWAQIIIHPSFFENPDWRKSLIHEIQHIIMSPYIAKVENTLNHWVTDEQLRGYLMGELNDIEESVCQDLALMAEGLQNAKN